MLKKESESAGPSSFQEGIGVGVRNRMTGHHHLSLVQEVSLAHEAAVVVGWSLQRVFKGAPSNPRARKMLADVTAIVRRRRKGRPRGAIRQVLFCWKDVHSHEWQTSQ